MTMRACEKNTFAAFSSKARACVRFARKQNCEIVARRRIERRIDHSQMRGRSGSRTNLFGSKFLHRASGSTWIRRHIGFPRVRVFSHAKPRETVLKIGALTWTAFSSLRRGEARHCERARARQRARANLEALADAAPARFRPGRFDSARFTHSRRAAGDGEGASVPPEGPRARHRRHERRSGRRAEQGGSAPRDERGEAVPLGVQRPTGARGGDERS